MELSGVKKMGDVLDEIILEEQEFECQLHGKFKGRPIYYSRINHKTNPPCPICQKEADERYAAEKQKRLEEQQKKEAEEQEQRRIDWLTGLNIGKRLWGESFETFHPYTDELKHHLDICVEFAENPQGRKLVMLGNNGTGKNHLAVSILKKTDGVIHTIFEIELMLKRSYSGETQEYKLIKRLCETELLVIDEIGRTKGGEWEENWLSYVINKRHENCMPMVLISNKHLKEDCPAGGCADCLQKWVGNDILSRITEDGLILEFTGEDYRERKRVARSAGGK